jgi:uncharacterized protein YkwD
MANRNVVKLLVRMVIVCLGPLLTGLTLALLAGPVPAQAAAGTARLNVALESSADYTHTVYLPVLFGAPSPEQQLVDLINAERTRRGVSALRVNPVLMQVAEAHSQDMVSRNFFDHTNPDGQDPCDRLNEAGYAWWACGENIGAGSINATPQAMFATWMSSPNHQAIMLSPNFTEIGIGYVAGGTYRHYWTADFARPR